MKILRPLALALTLALPVAAQDATQNAGPSLSDRVEALYSDPARNEFELAMLMGLQSLEELAQVQWRLGGSSGFIPMMPRIGPRNLRPQQMDPETVKAMLDTLIKDMAEVRSHLDKAEAAGVTAFDLDPNSLWVDINGNRVLDKGEEMTVAMRPLITGRRLPSRNTETPEVPTIRFDAADLHWLRAYTHMIEGAANLGLAFDPAPVLAALAEARKTLTDLPEKPYPWTEAELDAEEAALQARQKPLNDAQMALKNQIDPLRKEHRAITQDVADATPEQREEARKRANAFYAANIKPLMDEQREMMNKIRALSAELRAIKAKRPPSPHDMTLREQMLKEMGRANMPDPRDRTATIVDAIYILLKTLDQQPDTARLQAARDHWLRMIAINRSFWAAVEAETDDDHEWIPNPRQTSQFGLPNDPEAPAAWMRVLRDAEMVLNGDLLIPHPLLPEGTGIDLAAYIENPAPLDVIGWIQGVSAYPYAASGPRITSQYWQQFRRLTNGRATMFAFYYN